MGAFGNGKVHLGTERGTKGPNEKLASILFSFKGLKGTF
jgi:hypothetical protein